MATECIQKSFTFHPLRNREIRAQFDGGAIATEGGGLLLREVEKRVGIVRQFAACFRDYRNPDLIEHTVEELVAQRVYGLALGYEDLNDHEELRKDPLLAVLVGKSNPEEEVLAGKAAPAASAETIPAVTRADLIFNSTSEIPYPATYDDTATYGHALSVNARLACRRQGRHHPVFGGRTAAPHPMPSDSERRA